MKSTFRTSCDHYHMYIFLEAILKVRLHMDTGEKWKEKDPSTKTKGYEWLNRFVQLRLQLRIYTSKILNKVHQRYIQKHIGSSQRHWRHFVKVSKVILGVIPTMFMVQWATEKKWKPLFISSVTAFILKQLLHLTKLIIPSTPTF